MAQESSHSHPARVSNRCPEQPLVLTFGVKLAVFPDSHNHEISQNEGRNKLIHLQNVKNNIHIFTSCFRFRMDNVDFFRFGRSVNLGKLKNNSIWLKKGARILPSWLQNARLCLFLPL